MFVATETPDAPRGATLLAKVPLPMTDLQLQSAFAKPLGEWLAEQGLGFSLRCFPLPEHQNRPAGIGIEVQSDDVVLLALAVEKIAELGAPPATLIEIESDKATIEMSLAEVAGT